MEETHYISREANIFAISMLNNYTNQKVKEIKKNPSKHCAPEQKLYQQNKTGH